MYGKYSASQVKSIAFIQKNKSRGKKKPSRNELPNMCVTMSTKLKAPVKVGQKCYCEAWSGGAVE